MGRILCAWSPGWRIANWRRRNPSDSQPEPFALIETVRAVRRLGAVDEAAMRQGLYVTQKATDAMALVPGLTTAEAEPEADAAALEALADWCVRFSPAVALDAPDGLFLDISGVSHLWGGEAAMREDLLARLGANGLSFRVAIADTPGAAWALTHFRGDGLIAPPGGQAELLAPLPPQALRIEEAAAEQIERLGLKRIGQLMEIPRGPLARRFGQAVLDRLDQALGRSREALTFRRPATPWFARIAFFEPISAPEDMARVTSDICAKLCARLEAEGQGARRFDLAWHRVDGKAVPVGVGLARPGRDAGRIAKLFVPKLDYVDPGFGIDVVTIEAREVEALSARQARLDAAAEAAQHEGVAALVDRLVNRLGEAGVWRAQAVESHVPERAVRHGPALSLGPAWDRETPRPLRLFRRPEPVDQVIALLPDDPPVRFRWRGRLHAVARAEGPERIGAEWWKDGIDDVRIGHVRDYYRVEDETGCRFWLFRAGLYEDALPKWWLHGLFG